MSGSEPSPETLRELLHYDPETGVLTWLPRGVDQFKTVSRFKTWNGRYANKRALQTLRHGYLCGSINNRMFLAHRVIWAVTSGKWPASEIDHVNGVRTDNRLVNLRAVTRVENGRNVKTPNTNTSGVLGVYRARGGKFRAQIQVDRRPIHLGTFETVSEAAAVRKAAEVRFGFHENHGRLA